MIVQPNSEMPGGPNLTNKTKIYLKNFKLLIFEYKQYYTYNLSLGEHLALYPDYTSIGDQFSEPLSNTIIYENPSNKTSYINLDHTLVQASTYLTFDLFNLIKFNYNFDGKMGQEDLYPPPCVKKIYEKGSAVSLGTLIFESGIFMLSLRSLIF